MSRPSSTMILLLFVFFASTLAQKTPLEQLIEEAIYQANQGIHKNHRDVMEINGFRYNNIVDVQLGKISLSNFSTIALKGTPEIKQINREDGTSYYFDLAIGLDVLQVKTDYRVSFLILSSSRPVVLKNTGNAIRAKGKVNTFNGKDKPCNAVLESVAIDSFGDIDFEFGDGVFSWILNQLVKFAYSYAETYARSMANQLIADQVKSAQFQNSFQVAACSPFNF